MKSGKVHTVAWSLNDGYREMMKRNKTPKWPPGGKERGILNRCPDDGYRRVEAEVTASVQLSSESRMGGKKSRGADVKKGAGRG